MSAQEYYGVSQPWPYEFLATQRKKGQQETSSPSAVRTDGYPKTSTFPEPAEISDAPFQPESVDHKLASKVSDSSLNPDPKHPADISKFNIPDIADPEPILSDTSTSFSPDSINPKSITVLEPPTDENNIRRVPSEVITEVVTGETYTKSTQSRFQQIRQRQREVLETLLTHMARKYSEGRDTEMEGHTQRASGLRGMGGHVHREVGVNLEMERRQHNGKNELELTEQDREKRFSEFENQEHIWDDIEEDWSDAWGVTEDEAAAEDWSVPSVNDQNVIELAEPDSAQSPEMDFGNGVHDTENKMYPLLKEPSYGTEEYPLLNDGPFYDAYQDEPDTDGDDDAAEGSPTLGSSATQLHPLLTLTSVLIIIVPMLC